MIYRMIAFGLRNGFRMHRKVIGLPEGVPEAPGVYWALLGHAKGNTPAHMGWCAPYMAADPSRWKEEGRHPSCLFSEREEGRGGAPPPLSFPSRL